ncbi:MAG: DMT family transporter [Halofilum sp. (in: g-proteobacteria)]|nr:DMT family transporter [Halofilum sp. (in: g-proteobacteria)]
MGNLRGSLLMVAAMFGFALEDMLIKQMAGAMPMGQVLALIGAGGMINFAVLARLKGHRILSSAFLSTPVLLRNLGEVIASASFITALVLTTLSSASAILQATPLAVTLGAALFLGEPVGWRRWAAIAVGFAGVMLIIQPGLGGFAPASLLAVVAVAALALRDLASRRIPAEITGLQLATWAFASLVPTGAIMMIAFGEPAVMPAPPDIVRLAAAFVVGGCGYYAIVGATRTGDVAVVVPFRYTRLIFAMILGAVIFGERPGWLMLVGAALIVGAGLYTIGREAGLARQARRRPVAVPDPEPVRSRDAVECET